MSIVSDTGSEESVSSIQGKRHKQMFFLEWFKNLHEIEFASHLKGSKYTRNESSMQNPTFQMSDISYMKISLEFNWQRS